MNNNFLIKEIKKVKMNSPIVFLGMPGIGNVGKITIDFLIDNLKAKKINEILSNTLPNCAFVDDENIIELPKLEIYYKKFGTKDCLFVTGDVQPNEEKACYELCEDLANLFLKLHVKEVITFGGIGLEEVPKKIGVFISGTNKEILKKYKTNGLRDSTESLAGPIVGMSGVILGVCKEKKIQGVILLAETSGNPTYLGIGGAKELIKVINAKMKFELDIKQLDSEVREIEKELKERIEKIVQFPEEEKKVKKTKVNQENISYIG